MSLSISSIEFQEGDDIPRDYTCDGENINPPLTFDDVPEDAVSLVLIADDTDSPKKDFVHWLVWNIPPNTKEILSGELPVGTIEGVNDFGKMEYGGPCPHQGKHTYNFRLYALDVELELDEDADRKTIEREMAGHILDEAVLSGEYQRD